MAFLIGMRDGESHRYRVLNIADALEDAGLAVSTLLPDEHEDLAERCTTLGRLVADLRAGGLAVERVDLGGGLGIPYRAGDPAPPTPADYGALVARATAGWGVRLLDRFVLDGQE